MGIKIENKFTTPGLLNLGKYLIIDTETGGENAQDWSLLSIAAVVWQKGEVIAETEIFVCEQPEPTVLQRALDVNKIDFDWICANGLPPEQAFREFEAFLNKHFGGLHFNNLIRLMGHNLPFDISFLKRLIHYSGANKRGFDWFAARFQRNFVDTLTEVVDTIEAFNLPYPSEQFVNLKLSTCAQHFGLEIPENTHSALVDARLTGQLYTKLLRMKNPKYPEV